MRVLWPSPARIRGCRPLQSSPLFTSPYPTRRWCENEIADSSRPAVCDDVALVFVRQFPSLFADLNELPPEATFDAEVAVGHTVLHRGVDPHDLPVLHA